MSQVNTNAIYDASGGSNAVLYGVAAPVGGMNFRNRIINGDMRIDQRNAGASVTPSDGAYTLDRFTFSLSQPSKLTCQQNAGAVTPPAGFTNYLGVTSSSSYTVGASEWFALIHNIEGFNTADLNWGTANAQTVTLSFWVRSSLTGTFGGVLINSAANRSYPYTYTVSSANTWEQKSITITGDTTGTWVGSTNGLGLRVWFSLGAGASVSGTAGSWAGSLFRAPTGATSVVGTSGATFYITGVQLEAGSVATPFERRPYGTELALCQRYFTVIGSGSGMTLGAGCMFDTVTAYGNFSFPVTMRTTPTIYQTTGTDYYIFFRAGSGDGCNSLTLAQTSPQGAEFYNNSQVSGTSGVGGFWRTSAAGAYFAVQAEL